MPQTLSQAMIDGTLGEMSDPNAQPLPWYLDMAESVPRITGVAAAKTFRGSGTILRGGSGLNAGAGGWVREGMRQANYGNPRNWMQFGTQDYFHHQGKLSVPRAGGKGRTTTYNPFYMAAGVNAIGRGLGGQSEGRIGTWLSNRGFAETMRANEFVGEGKELMSKGFFSRVNASARMGMMSNLQFGRAAGSSYQFLQGAGYTADQAQSILMAGKTQTRQAIIGSGVGTASGYLGGFAARTLGDLDGPTTAAWSDKARKGADRAGRWAHDLGIDRQGGRITARSSLGATVGKVKDMFSRNPALRQGAGKGALKGLGLMGGSLMTGPAAPFIFAAGTAMLVYDLAKMTTKGAGYAARLGVDAYKSFQGGMRTGIMEQGFTDSEATMTSRARGVQAIQNSRLNARGVLGAEAGAMHAHFG